MSLPATYRTLYLQPCEECHASELSARVCLGVVWFGETLPGNILKQAEVATRDGDIFLSIGTSALVYPSAGLPGAATEAGALVVQINPDTTSLDSLATFNIHGTRRNRSNCYSMMEKPDDTQTARKPRQCSA